MATQSDEYPLVLARETLDELEELLWETCSTPTVTARALELGATPPDAREGWSIAYAYGPRGEDIGLVWSEPNYPED